MIVPHRRQLQPRDEELGCMLTSTVFCKLSCACKYNCFTCCKHQKKVVTTGWSWATRTYRVANCLDCYCFVGSPSKRIFTWNPFQVLRFTTKRSELEVEVVHTVPLYQTAMHCWRIVCIYSALCFKTPALWRRNITVADPWVRLEAVRKEYRLKSPTISVQWDNNQAFEEVWTTPHSATNLGICQGQEFSRCGLAGPIKMRVFVKFFFYFDG